MRKTNAWNVFVTVLVVATLAKVWMGPITIEPAALAQIPDAAAQRIQMIAELKQTNQLLTAIKDILEHRTLNVRIAGADNPSTDK